MIKATELRIGNIVKPIDYDFQLYVDEIKRNGIRDGSVLYTYETIEPVILTSEILESCGFEYRELHQRYVLKYYMKQEIKLLIKEVGFSFIGTNKRNIKSLHQLQNLYFALTGEELLPDKISKAQRHLIEHMKNIPQKVREEIING